MPDDPVISEIVELYYSLDPKQREEALNVIKSMAGNIPETAQAQV
jgi:hypothetical protein